VVTVPEPLAVSETVQLYRGLRDRADLHLGHLFINRIPPVWLNEDERRLVRDELEGPSAGEPWARDLVLADYLVRRGDTAEKCMRGLKRDIDLPTLGARPEDGAAIIEGLARRLEAELLR
jgi:hypothetical protein